VDLEGCGEPEVPEARLSYSHSVRRPLCRGGSEDIWRRRLLRGVWLRGWIWASNYLHVRHHGIIPCQRMKEPPLSRPDHVRAHFPLTDRHYLTSLPTTCHDQP
jgi:hypothetical protein